MEIMKDSQNTTSSSQKYNILCLIKLVLTVLKKLYCSDFIAIFGEYERKILIFFIKKKNMM